MDAFNDVVEAFFMAACRRYVDAFDWRACAMGSKIHTVRFYSLAQNLGLADDDWWPRHPVLMRHDVNPSHV